MTKATRVAALKIDFLFENNSSSKDTPILRIIDIGPGLSAGYQHFPAAMREKLVAELQTDQNQLIPLFGELHDTMLLESNTKPPEYRNPQSIQDVLKCQGSGAIISGIKHLEKYAAGMLEHSNTSLSLTPALGFLAIENKAWWHLLMQKYLPPKQKPTSTVLPVGSKLPSKGKFISDYEPLSANGFFIKDALSRGRAQGVQYHATTASLYEHLAANTKMQLESRQLTKSLVIEPAYVSKTETNRTGRAFIILSMDTQNKLTLSCSHGIWIYSSPPTGSQQDYISNISHHSRVEPLQTTEISELNTALKAYGPCFAQCFTHADIAKHFPNNSITTTLRADINDGLNQILNMIAETNIKRRKQNSARLLLLMAQDRIKQFLQAPTDLQYVYHMIAPKLASMIQRKTASEIRKTTINYSDIIKHNADREKFVLYCLTHVSSFIQLHQIRAFPQLNIQYYKRIMLLLMTTYLQQQDKDYTSLDFDQSTSQAIQCADIKTIIVLLYTHHVQVSLEHIKQANKSLSHSDHPTIRHRILAIVLHVHWAQHCNKHKLPYNTRDTNRALRQAAFAGDAKTIAFLMKNHSANPLLPSPSGKTALDIASNKFDKAKPNEKMIWKHIVTLLTKQERRINPCVTYFPIFIATLLLIGFLLIQKAQENPASLQADIIDTCPTP